VVPEGILPGFAQDFMLYHDFDTPASARSKTGEICYGLLPLPGLAQWARIDMMNNAFTGGMCLWRPTEA
jgi:hypothetical protein